MFLSGKGIDSTDSGFNLMYHRELLKNTVKLESQLIFAQRERAGGQNSEPALGECVVRQLADCLEFLFLV